MHVRARHGGEAAHATLFLLVLEVLRPLSVYCPPGHVSVHRSDAHEVARAGSQLEATNRTEATHAIITDSSVTSTSTRSMHS